MPVGPFLFIYVALVGFFAFSALYHLILWWSSRREMLLAVFSIDCAFRAVIAGTLATVITATTPAEAHGAMRARVAFGMMAFITLLWSLSKVSGVRARWFVWPVTGILLTLATIHSLVMALNTDVVSVERVTMPWGETVSNPQMETPGWWLGPMYSLGVAIACFALWCGFRLWKSDRIAGALIMATACGTLSVFALEALRTYMGLPIPFTGVISNVFWVCAMALLIARSHRQTREELAASEQKFRGIFDQTFQFIGLMKTDGTLIEANHTALKFAGIREEDVLGKPFWETPWWSHSPELQNRLRDAVREATAGKTVRFEASHPLPDGGLAHVDFSLKPIRDQAGSITLLIPEGRDISQRKQSEEALKTSEARIQAILHAIPDLMFRMNREGLILDFYASRQNELYVSPEQFLGKRMVDVLPAAIGMLFQDHLRKTFDMGEPQSFEYELELLQKGPMIFEARMVRCNDDETVSIVRNITERKRAEKALHESEERFRALVEHGFEGINVIDGRGILVYAGPGNQSILGFTAEEIAGRPILETIHPDDLSEAQVVWAEALKHPEKIYTPQLRFRHKDGSWRLMEVSARNLLHLPAVRGVVVNWRDVTRRKLAEEKLRASEEKLRAIIDNEPECVKLLDREGKLLEMNPAGLRMIEAASIEQVRGAAVGCLVRPEDQAAFDDMVTAVFRGESRTLAFEIKGLAGTKRILETHSVPMWDAEHREVRALLGVTLDITERKRAEEALREPYRFNAQIIASAQEGLIVMDRDLRYLMWNPKMETISGLTAEQVLGKHPLELFPFLQDAGVIRQFEQALEGETVTSIDFPFEIPSTGFKGWAMQYMGPLRNSLNEIIGVLVSVFDITARKEGEAKLIEAHRANEEILAVLDTLQEAAPVGIAFVTTDFRYVRCNDALAEINGVPASEHIGKHVGRVVPDLWPKIEPLYRSVLSGEKSSVQQEVIGETAAQPGQERHWLVNYYPVKIGDEIIGIGVIVHEITDRVRAEETRRKLESELAQSKKMEAIGQLAGGVAHDFNNMLTVINGYASMLQSMTPPTEETYEMLVGIHDAGDRAASLTRQLLTFSRQQVVEPRVLDLNEVVKETEKMLKRLIGEDISLVTVFNSGLKQVMADPGQIGQVIVNLAVNARDAMPTGGKLTIETDNVEIDGTFAASHPSSAPGSYVLLAVTDSGSGMSPEVQAHIFEPFFTTKGLGKGTGLGLATVRTIVEECGGFLSVYSEPGLGSTFKAYFPALTTTLSAEDPEPAAKAPPRGAETILLVEDDSSVRALTRTILRQYGYTVVEASSGAEAIELVEQHKGPFDLIVTDVVMPEISGPQLVVRLKVTHPNLKVLYLSGYTDDAVLRHGVLQAEVAFLQKPFTVETLARKVRQTLDAGVGFSGM